MIEAEIKALIQKELPRAIAEEPGVRDFVLRTVSEYYTPRTEFDEKFDRVLNDESAIGAIGSRWGLYSEASFRNGLKAILGQSFGVEVLNLTLYDQEGEVFGRPEQVELDIIIKNGLTIVC
ncbi:DUF3782 domain-containing protein, partial [Cylindrospermopsis raciborskii]|uniref:DUF3782 domain-containing protein n=1 Tax=Cylindrospermopsis raciborskii TaxID=77022 RepID=UPI000B225D3F